MCLGSLPRGSLADGVDAKRCRRSACFENEWRAHQESDLLEQFVMAMSRRQASGRKQARRFWGARPRKLVPTGHEFIPTSVLKQLSELRLPLSKEAYIARLNELLGE